MVAHGAKGVRASVVIAQASEDEGLHKHMFEEDCMNQSVPRPWSFLDFPSYSDYPSASSKWQCGCETCETSRQTFGAIRFFR
eukprot:5223637-Amphidinium_carterae.1